MEEYLTPLIPVSEWVWNLYRVTYHESEDSPAVDSLTRHIVSTDTHVQGEVCEGDTWPRPSCTYARWEVVAEKVARPRSIGQLYGHSISESGWAAGEREAKKRGLGER